MNSVRAGRAGARAVCCFFIRFSMNERIFNFAQCAFKLCKLWIDNEHALMHACVLGLSHALPERHRQNEKTSCLMFQVIRIQRKCKQQTHTHTHAHTCDTSDWQPCRQTECFAQTVQDETKFHVTVSRAIRATRWRWLRINATQNGWWQSARARLCRNGFGGDRMARMDAEK